MMKGLAGLAPHAAFYGALSAALPAATLLTAVAIVAAVVAGAGVAADVLMAGWGGVVPGGRAPTGWRWAPPAAAAWLLLEAAFYLFFVRRRQRLQRTGPPPALLAPAERDALFENCMAATVDLESFLRGWFLGAPLALVRRGNLEQWLAWAFFGRRWRELDEDARAEVGGRVRVIEDRLGRTFPTGYDPAVHSMRVTLDPLEAYHHPLGYYMLLALVDRVHGATLRLRGFVRHRAGRHMYWYWPGRGAAPGTGTPIVLLHGIGIGLAPYAPLVRDLRRLGQPLLLVELPHIASRICDEVPSVRATVDDLAAALARHGHAHAVFVGHSMGTGPLCRAAALVCMRGRGSPPWGGDRAGCSGGDVDGASRAAAGARRGAGGPRVLYAERGPRRVQLSVPAADALDRVDHARVRRPGAARRPRAHPLL
jgi:hypothetical protein